MSKSIAKTLASTAALFSFSLAAFAQTPSQSPSQQPSARPSAQQVTITGCVQSEADYRQAKNLGRGGAAATGVGVGNEYVITNASAREKAGEAPAGTAGTTGDAYEVTGAAESQLKEHAGKRVEITGTIKAAEKAAGKPTGGTDPLNQDLRLPELEIASVKTATGDCPAR